MVKNILIGKGAAYRSLQDIRLLNLTRNRHHAYKQNSCKLFSLKVIDLVKPKIKIKYWF